MSDELPWLNFPALDYLKKNLRPEFKVFEYGGGGSTLFFCKNVAKTFTVEHDPNWFEVLKVAVRKKGYQNWEGELIVPDKGKANMNLSPAQPDDFVSNSKEFRAMRFETYARYIKKYPKEFFDVVVVDGRSRPACIKQALSHIKSGGILVVDNTERPYYLSNLRNTITKNFRTELETYAPVAYTPNFTQTTIFRRI
ncbi:MAG: hypothetical protein R3D58_20375 [Saprospiraceae bacterium]